MRKSGSGRIYLYMGVEEIRNSLELFGLGGNLKEGQKTTISRSESLAGGRFTV